MCRWLAYSGPSICLDALLVSPDHSLLDQSKNARENVHTTNGDGFGVGWYGDGNTPGVYRDTHPAWNDDNLKQLAAHLHSGLFLAHVRAATGTAVQRTNCHPYRFESWLFQHNGFIPEFHRIKRTLQFEIAAELFPSIQGSTDSETLFYLALTLGLRDDPPAALERTIGLVERIRAEAGIDDPVYFSAAATDGKFIYAVRYSSHGQSRTLYHSQHIHALQSVHNSYDALPEGACIVVSEPLDELTDHWQRVPDSSLIVVADDSIITRPFKPQ